MESSGVPAEAVESESPALDEPALTADDRVNTARKSRDSSKVEVRSLPFSSVAGSR
ncbi:MAG TPA: hypothetical protein VF468_27000 [Actinomycetota bacterium]|nr:hypothetical protein [Actinomycetota bacterium]